MRLTEIMRLIEHTARWVDPETFCLLPLWYPEHARRAHFYKKGWSEPQMNKNRQTGFVEHKREGNVHANKAEPGSPSKTSLLTTSESTIMLIVGPVTRRFGSGNRS
jgi:hypothetical protein